MRFISFVSLVCITAASPLSFRQSSDTRNELENGNDSTCPRAIFIFARASGEEGNMGGSTGPIVANQLEIYYGGANVWVQGVGGPYTAEREGNFLLQGTTQGAIEEAARLFIEANAKCPSTPVVAGGYSQGTAVIAGAIPALTARVRDQVKGIGLFGYTRNQQNDGGIPSYPGNRLRVFCADGDLVCNGTLIVRPPHFSYNDDARNEAPPFLEALIE